MIYLFRCDECGLVIEEDHRMGEAPKVSVCPICVEKTRRVYPVLATHYRGEGWAGNSHGVPTPDERAKQPGAQEYDDLLED